MKEVRTQVEIAVDAEAAWDALTDFESYAHWNPFIRKVSGRPVLGAKLLFEVALGDGRTTTARATVLAMEPGRRLVWGGAAPFGLFRAAHSFEITTMETGVRLENREQFSGFLSYFTISRDRLAAQAGAFKLQDDALKKWLEQPSKSA